MVKILCFVGDAVNANEIACPLAVTEPPKSLFIGVCNNEHGDDEVIY
jgi:hypothetical protein